MHCDPRPGADESCWSTPLNRYLIGIPATQILLDHRGVKFTLHNRIEKKEEDFMNEGILCLHKGAKACTRDELDLIPVPPETETYQPVSHYGLTSKLLTIARDILTGFTLSKESYGLAREGHQLFGVLQF